MTDSTDKASDPERRVSTRTSRGVSLTLNGPPILEEMEFDEEDYALMALGIMPSSGGYQPASEHTYTPGSMQTPVSTSATSHEDRGTTFEPATRPDSPSTPATSAITASPGPTSSSTRLNRSSISKTPRGRDSLTLRHDGSSGYVAASRPQQLAQQPPQQATARSSVISTASSDAAYLVSDGPYRGPTAPSHSYSFYPQHTERPARTMSIATTSTMPSVRPESEYNGPTGPSHPYSMYPQMPLGEATPEPAVPAIPVGFTTAADPYQRRLGPEGEELADIIGPDGHTEELPPYTRYPDEHYARKIRGDNAPEPVEERAGPSAVAAPATAITMAAIPAVTASPISGAGGIGLAARNPEFDARSVEDGVSPGSRHSSRSFASDSQAEINTAAAAASEKPQLGKWQKLAKKKACGVIPYWALGLTFTAVLIVLIIVAAVVGSLISHRPGPKKPSPTNYQDSVPPATITFDATPIPTPSDLPALAQGTFGLPLNLNSAPQTCFNDTTQSQAWSCDIAFNQAVALQLQVTRNAPQLGKDGTYEVMLITNSSSSAPDDDGKGPSANSLMYGSTAPAISPAMNMELVNDTFDLNRGPAWFRMLPYNKTVVIPEELFSSSTSSKNRRGDLSFVPTVGHFQRKGVARAGDKPWICVWPDTFVEIFIYATQNSSYASQDTATITSQPATTTTATSTGSSPTPRAPGDDDVMPARLALYPRAIKLKERRVNESPRAYCYQVTVQKDNTTTTPITDSDGTVLTVDIEEIEQSNGMDKRGDLVSRGSDGDMSDCGCMWFSS